MRTWHVVSNLHTDHHAMFTTPYGSEARAREEAARATEQWSRYGLTYRVVAVDDYPVRDYQLPRLIQEAQETEEAA